MPLLRRIAFRLRALTRSRKAEAELDEELRFHLDQLVEANLARGMGPRQARAAALRAFGGVEQAKENCRDAWRVRVLQDFVRDLGYGWRAFLQRPRASLLIVALLAMGIGLTTTVYTLFDAVALKPLPFEKSEQLAFVWQRNHERGYTQFALSLPNFMDARARLKSFQSLAAFDAQSASLRAAAGDRSARRLPTLRVSAGYFEMLRTPPLLGRSFLPADEVPGSQRVAIMGEGLWRSAYGADPNIVGSSVDLDGQPTEIVGIAPQRAALAFGITDPDVFLPLREEYQDRDNHYLLAIGRLQDGVDIRQAETELQLLMAQIADENPDYVGWDAFLVGAKGEVVGETKSWTTIVMLAVALLLAVACANASSLILAEAIGRRKEFATRLALGASRPRLFRQLLAESFALVSIGGGLGALIAVAGVQLAVTRLPPEIVRPVEIAMDGRALLVVVGLTVGASVLFSLFPLREAMRASHSEALQAEGRGSTGQGHRVLNAIVALELALSVTLLAGAVALARGFATLQETPLGFDVESVDTTNVSLAWDIYPALEQRAAYYEQAAERAAAVPGIDKAGWISGAPFGDSNTSNSIFAPGDSELEADTEISLRWRIADNGYFAAHGLALVAGPGFTSSKRPGDEPEIMVNESLAKRIWGEQSPIGRPLRSWLATHTVVGVVEDARWSWSANASDSNVVYLPLNQYPWWTPMTLVTRRWGDAASVAPALRSALEELDRQQPYWGDSSMRELLRRSQANARLSTSIMAIIALSALALSIAGIYGIVSYSVSQRVREIGVRMSLGAESSSVVRLFLRIALKLAALGVGCGLLGAWAAVRQIHSWVRLPIEGGVAALLAIAATLILTALLAACLPALRATRISPMDALRVG